MGAGSSRDASRFRSPSRQRAWPTILDSVSRAAVRGKETHDNIARREADRQIERALKSRR